MPNEFTITQKVSDLFVMNILSEKLQYEPFEYIIYSQNKTLLRKGSFRAPSVQIRTNNMDKGTYYIQLLHQGKEWIAALFEKQDIKL